MNKKVRNKKLKVLTQKRSKLMKTLGKINSEIQNMCCKGIDLEIALKREYKITTQSKGNDKISCRIIVPICLSNKIVKLKLVKDTE